MRILTGLSAKMISALALFLGLAFCPGAPAQIPNPIQAAKDAYNKAKQQQQQKSQQQGQQQTQQPNQQQAGTPDNSASQPAAQPAGTANQTSNPDTQSAAAGSASQGAAAPWKPPSDNPGAAPAPAGPLDPSKLPDISGLHLGTSLAEATALMKKWYPKGVGTMNGTPLGPQHQSALAVLRGTGDYADSTEVDVTAPPNPQVVWSLIRGLNQPNVAHNVIVTSLRQKYGKETYADYRTDPAGKPIIDDSQIRNMWWVFDEQGHLLSQAKMIQGTPFGCGTADWHLYQDFMLGHDTGLSTYCTSSYVGVLAQITNEPILKSITLNIVDLPLMARSAQATAARAKGQDDKGRQEELQREKQMKPQL